MSKRDDQMTLNDMLGHAREAVELLGDASRENLKSNRVMQWDTVTSDLPPLVEALETIIKERT